VLAKPSTNAKFNDFLCKPKSKGKFTARSKLWQFDSLTVASKRLTVVGMRAMKPSYASRLKQAIMGDYGDRF
jgi:hypothetical protein